jgi:hypothetical protein
MAYVTKKTLFEEINSVVQLPEHIDKKPLINLIIDKWLKHPLLEKVLAGETTFEQAFKPLVESFRNLSCYEPEFVKLSTEIKVMFNHVVDLSPYVEQIAFAGISYHPIYRRVTDSMIKISLIRMWLMSTFNAFKSKQVIAGLARSEEILEDCRFLDKMIAVYLQT